MEGIVDISELFRKFKFICYWIDSFKNLKCSNVSGIKLSSFFKSNDTFTSLQALSNLHLPPPTLFSCSWIILVPTSRSEIIDIGTHMREDYFLYVQSCKGFHTICLSGKDVMCGFGKAIDSDPRSGFIAPFDVVVVDLVLSGLRHLHMGNLLHFQITSSGWPFVSAVLGQMAHLVSSITLNSARSCVMQSAFLTQRTVSNIPIIFSWSDSIRPEGFLSSVLLWLVIIIAVVGVGVTVVVVVESSSVVKLSFVIT
ncbi:hypothetical protein Tco_1392081 [Tanacetum coccineum]